MYITDEKCRNIEKMQKEETKKERRRKQRLNKKPTKKAILSLSARKQLSMKIIWGPIVLTCQQQKTSIYGYAHIIYTQCVCVCVADFI
jgi:hypothetical protein